MIVYLSYHTWENIYEGMNPSFECCLTAMADCWFFPLNNKSCKGDDKLQCESVKAHSLHFSLIETWVIYRHTLLSIRKRCQNQEIV